MGLGQCILNTEVLDLWELCEIDEKQYNMGPLTYRNMFTETRLHLNILEPETQPAGQCLPDVVDVKMSTTLSSSSGCCRSHSPWLFTYVYTYVCSVICAGWRSLFYFVVEPHVFKRISLNLEDTSRHQIISSDLSFSPLLRFRVGLTDVRDWTRIIFRINKSNVLAQGSASQTEPRVPGPSDGTEPTCRLQSVETLLHQTWIHFSIFISSSHLLK